MEKKHVTIIGVNYFPEETAIGLYSTQMAEFLVGKGYIVEVITGFPYYPQWKIHDVYKSKPKKLSEKINGVTIHRFKQYVPKSPTFVKRIIHIIDFTIGSLSNLKKIKNTDLIIAIVPFTTTLFLGNFLKSKTKAKLWGHFQDFEIDAAKESGFSNSKNWLKSSIFKIAFYKEKQWLKKYDVLSSISSSMLKKLKEKSNKETFYFPNWIELDHINPLQANPHNYYDNQKFNILYAGNIGEKQDWDFFMKFCEAFDKNNEVKINIVGDGAKKEWLLHKIKNYSNVNYFPTVPLNELSDLLCNAQLHILFQRQNVVDAVMPSKILGMMASEKPSIITGNLNSEIANIIEKSSGGYYFNSKDLNQVVQKTLELIEKTNILATGKRARNYIRENYSQQVVLNKFELKIQELLNK